MRNQKIAQKQPKITKRTSSAYSSLSSACIALVLIQLIKTQNFSNTIQVAINNSQFVDPSTNKTTPCNVIAVLNARNNFTAANIFVKVFPKKYRFSMDNYRITLNLRDISLNHTYFNKSVELYQYFVNLTQILTNPPDFEDQDVPPTHTNMVTFDVQNSLITTRFDLAVQDFRIFSTDQKNYMLSISSTNSTIVTRINDNVKDTINPAFLRVVSILKWITIPIGIAKLVFYIANLCQGDKAWDQFLGVTLFLIYFEIFTAVKVGSGAVSELYWRGNGNLQAWSKKTVFNMVYALVVIDVLKLLLFYPIKMFGLFRTRDFADKKIFFYELLTAKEAKTQHAIKVSLALCLFFGLIFAFSDPIFDSYAPHFCSFMPLIAVVEALFVSNRVSSIFIFVEILIAAICLYDMYFNCQDEFGVKPELSSVDVWGFVVFIGLWLLGFAFCMMIKTVKVEFFYELISESDDRKNMYHENFDLHCRDGIEDYDDGDEGKKNKPEVAYVFQK